MSTHELRLQKLQRLAAKGREQGCFHLPVAGSPGGYFVTSSKGDAAYLVRVFADQVGSCNCAGFQNYGACKHYALALIAEGLMPETGNMPAKRSAA